MKKEIATVVFFLKRLLNRGENLESDKVELFVERLAVALQEKFKGHWYPENPSKGQAYRCIRMNRVHRQDPELLRACQETGIQYSDLRLPHELTLWVDPGDVCCRYREHNPCFSVDRLCNSEGEYEDVAKKVISALERLTSDYHSGSSSHEESLRTSPPTLSNSHCAHQLNPNAPSWHPKKRAPENCPTVSKPHNSFRPCSRAPHTCLPNLWIPPVYAGGPVYWDTNQNVAYC